MYLIGLCLSGGLVIIATRWIRDWLLFHPDPNLTSYRPTEAETIDLPSVSGWYLPGRPLVIHCHANTGNISHRDYMVSLCRGFNLGLVLFDYPGYGQTPGQPSVEAICQTADRVYHWARTKTDPDQIIVWGESLGGVAAVYLASQYPCRRLLLMGVLSSLDDIASIRVCKLVGWLVRLVIDPVPVKNQIDQVSCPVAIIHSLDDQLVPFNCSQILYDRVSHDQKLLIPIRGPHAQPIITKDQLELFLGMTGDSALVEVGLEQLRTAVERYQL